MTIFCKRAVHLVYRMCSLYTIFLCILDISNFGFAGGIWVLPVLAPGNCIFFDFYCFCRLFLNSLCDIIFKSSLVLSGVEKFCSCRVLNMEHRCSNKGPWLHTPLCLDWYMQSHCESEL